MQVTESIDTGRHVRTGSLWPGLVLIAIAWPLAWFGNGGISEFTFFPLWLGYILTVAGLVRIRTGTSLVARNSRAFVSLFIMSIPLWWFYELLNERLGNWVYLHSPDTDWFQRRLMASVAFSIVVPALFETAELYCSFGIQRRFGKWRTLAPGRNGLLGFVALGVAMIGATLLFPRQGFPFVWIGFFFVIDPIVNLLGGHSLSAQVAKGRWDTAIALFLAGITCGFFWEMWNYWSFPKWTYLIPYVDRPKIFEMPILGYGGYLPFALEVYAAVQALNLVVKTLPDGYLKFDDIR